MNEKLSAFMDNELSELEERQLLKEMSQNDALKSAWERYHVIGAALRHEPTASISDDVRARVVQAISADAPKSKTFGAAVLASGIGKAVGGFAIAASVATVAIVSMRPSLTPQTAELAANAPVYAPVVLNGDAKQKSTQLATMDPLNSYLVEHNEYAPIAGIGGVLPYVRTVDFDHTPSQ